MVAVIDTLIDKSDAWELVRDKIATILKEEQAEQQALALAAGKADPTRWALRVFLEAGNPIEDWQEAPTDAPTPIVNVSLESITVDGQASDPIERQQFTATYTIDCYGYGFAEDDGSTGQILGDSAAALECQRCVRLVRNILMASHYTYLGMRGVVGQRWVQSVTVFQPQFNDSAMQQIVAARIQFEVRMTEAAPQYVAQYLREIGVTVYRAETGEIYLQGEYDHDS